MSFEFDASGIKPSGGFEPVPKGTYLLKIIKATEKRSKSAGYPQVVVDFEVQDKDYLGKKIRFHNVTFLPRDKEGAGMAIHFVKSIGEPFEGPLQIDATRWVGKLIIGSVDIEMDWNNFPRNAVKGVRSMNSPLPEANEEGVPF